MISTLLVTTLAAQRIVDRIPECTPLVREIRLEELHHPEGRVQGAAGANVIYLNRDLARSELREVIIHECGHLLHQSYEDQYSIRTMFGKHPHISDYAKTDWREDFAETYLSLKRGHEPAGFQLKFDLIRNIINQAISPDTND